MPPATPSPRTAGARHLVVLLLGVAVLPAFGQAPVDFQLGGVANSIVIRGVGGGGHGGDLGAVVDGIPLNEAMSHADGIARVPALTPASPRASPSGDRAPGG